MNYLQPPIGIYNSIKDWIAKDEVHLNGINIKEIYPAVPVLNKIRRPPCPTLWYPNEFESGSVAVIPNGRVWGANGAIITPDNHLIWDVSFEGVHITPDSHSIFQQKYLPAVSFVKNAVDLTHVYSGNYYHWMYEVIPRIDLLQQSGLKADHFIVNTNIQQTFQQETLNQLEIKMEQFLMTHDDFHVQVENLITPSQPAFPTKWGYDFLRKTFLSDSMIKSSDKKRIFITRRWSRKIENEDQLMEVLTKYDFEKVGLESMSVTEQAKLFSSAEMVIAAHGAALTNLTFCHPGTKVLEIFTDTYIIPHYWAISALANLNYFYFIGNSVVKKTNKNRWTGGDDISIDIPKFKSYLESIYNS